MYLQRIFDTSDPENPKLLGVRLKANPGQYQKFSPEFISKAASDGFCSVVRGKIIIHTEQGDVVYRVSRSPGVYCCHCGRPQDSASEAMKHLVRAHAKEGGPVRLYELPGGKVQTSPPPDNGLPEYRHRIIAIQRSPDPNNYFGYEKLNAFDCILEQGQDARSGAPPPRPRPEHGIRLPRVVK